MMAVISHLFVENLAYMAFFISLAFIISWIAYSSGYYKLPYKNFEGPNLALQDVFSFFFIFIVFYFLGQPFLIATALKYTSPEHRLITLIVSPIAISLLTAFFFFLYSYLGNPKALLRIWKDSSFPLNLPLLADIKLGLVFWVLGMPVIATLTYLAELFTSLIAKPTSQEQVAVKFLKDSLNSPILTVSLLSILIIAPLFEELLFRGVLLSYLRKKTGSLTAIFISSLIFSLFHFSPSQSTENIPILFTLFAFGCYLGFVYEKTRSLFSSIVLHVTFNSISVIRIIFTHV